jgi:hypothetical protein
MGRCASRPRQVAPDAAPARLDARANRIYCSSMPLAIDRILSSAPQVKKDGQAWVIPEESDATAFVALGQEVLQIPRIMRIELGTEAVFLTHKGERFYFAPEQVVGLRFGGPEARHKIGSAGFMK